MAATTRAEIIKQIVKDFKDKYNSINGFTDITNIYRGSIFSDEIKQFPALSIDFMSDVHEDGDFMDDNAVRTITMEVQGAINTSSLDYDNYDEFVEKVENFLRSSYFSYEAELDEVKKIEANEYVSHSYFSVKFSIRYDRQY